MNNVSETSLVVGASRGLGRGIAAALAEAGSKVVAVARSTGGLESLAQEHGGVTIVAADATHPGVAAELLAEHRPRVLVLSAGATPTMLPIHEQSWDTFRVNWETDVRIGFEWIGAALRQPLDPGSHIVVMSSGAVIKGSPLSGGYSGAKATLKYLAEYARQESQRAGLGVHLTTLLPTLTPVTDLGKPAVAAYAARSGMSEAEFIDQMGATVTPQIAGAAVLELVGEGREGAGWMLTGEGLRALA